MGLLIIRNKTYDIIPKCAPSINNTKCNSLHWKFKNLMSLIIKYTVGIWIWAATLVILVPGELVHSFMGHHDTEDDMLSGGETVIDAIHVHCFVLKAQLPEYVMGCQLFKTINVWLITPFTFNYCSPHISYYPFPIGLRAPPEFA
jgi:hypothetical protein